MVFCYTKFYKLLYTVIQLFVVRLVALDDGRSNLTKRCVSNNKLDHWEPIVVIIKFCCDLLMANLISCEYCSSWNAVWCANIARPTWEELLVQEGSATSRAGDRSGLSENRRALERFCWHLTLDSAPGTKCCSHSHALYSSLQSVGLIVCRL